MQWPSIKTDYSSYVFDCDGVILDSNHIKSDAFYSCTLSYGEEIAQKFVQYHKANGGITRQVKFEYFCREILGLMHWQDTYLKLLDNYAEIVKEELKTATLIPGVINLLTELKDSGKELFVVTGGNEDETKKILTQKNINHYFSLILGNPVTKHQNMTALKEKGLFEKQSFYFGDAVLDYELALEFGLDFLCIYGVSEWKNIPATIHKTKDFISIIE